MNSLLHLTEYAHTTSASCTFKQYITYNNSNKIAQGNLRKGHIAEGGNNH